MRLEQRRGWEIQFVRSVGLAKDYDTKILHNLTRQDRDAHTIGVVEIVELGCLAISRADGVLELRNSTSGEVTATTQLSGSRITGIFQVPGESPPRLHVATELGEFLEVLLPSMEVVSKTLISEGIAEFCVSANGTVAAILDYYLRNSVTIRPPGDREFRKPFSLGATGLRSITAESPSSFVVATEAGEIHRLVATDDDQGLKVANTWDSGAGLLTAVMPIRDGLLAIAGSPACVRIFDTTRQQTVAVIPTGTASVNACLLYTSPSPRD